MSDDLFEPVPILPPCYDFVFKRIFGENEAVFISFINSIFERTGERKVVSIVYQNNEFPKEYLDGRSNILDVRATLDDGTQCNVEVQVREQTFYEARTLFHWARLYYEQIKKGQTFQDLKKTICINILDFTLFSEEDFFNHYIIVNEKSLKKAFDEFGIYFFELPKFRQNQYTQTESHTRLENWTSFLSDNKKENLEKLAMQEEAFQQAYEKLKYLSSDKDMQYLYHMERMKEIGIKTDLRAAEEKGIAEGEIRGKKEANLANARKMKAKGFSIAEIMEFTELTEEEIRAL